jgi:hypothetical protein
MVLLSLAVLTPALARAQEPFHTLQGLQADIRKGETIRVEGTDGKKVQGTVVDISDSSLKLKIKGVSREFREPQIREVRKQYNDSIANGMRNGVIIGAIAGAVLGAAISDAFCDGCGNNQAGGAAIIGLFGAGIGAATGVVGDAMTKGYLTVFTGPKTAGNRFGVSPLLSKETKGMKLAFRF